MRRTLITFIVLSILSACGGEEEETPVIRDEPSPHGVVLLYDEEMRKWSDINSCGFEEEAGKWVAEQYPLGQVVDKGWASSGFYYVTVEIPEKRYKIYFDGTIVNIQLDCGFW